MSEQKFDPRHDTNPYYLFAMFPSAYKSGLAFGQTRLYDFTFLGYNCSCSVLMQEDIVIRSTFQSISAEHRLATAYTITK